VRVPAYITLRGAGAALTALHLDFDPSDFGLLHCIASAAPFLTALKLVEQCHNTVNFT